MKEHDTTKLPRWAQDHIDSIYRSNAELREEIAMLRLTEQGTGKVVIERFPSEKAVSIDDHAQVIFTGKNGSITVGLRDGNVEASTNRGTITVLPSAANVVVLRETEW